MSVLEVTLLGLFAGVMGTGLGGLLSTLLSKISSTRMSLLLGLSAGIMLAIATFELMPEALEYGSIATAVIGLIIGTLVMAGIDIFFPHLHLLGTKENSRFIKAGVILGLGIAMHNFPEGLAIGVGGMQDAQLGIALAAAIAIHNIPEGLAMALPLNIGKVRTFRVLISTATVGIPMGFGALVGGLVGQISPVVVSVAFGFAAGAMLFITCDEMIPQAESLSKGHSATFGIISGVIIGILILSFIGH